MISLTCTCGKSYSFKPKFQGQTLRCSECNAPLVVPRIDPEPQPETPVPVKSQPISPQPPQSTPAPESRQNAPNAGEYYFVSGSAPAFLKDFAIQEPEDSGPPSEALSVVLSRAAVDEYMLSREDTLGVRPTPVPIPQGAMKKIRRSRESDVDPTQSERHEQPVLIHAPQNNTNYLIVGLLVGIFVLLLCIGLYLIFSGGVSDNESSTAQTQKLEMRFVKSEHEAYASV